MTVPGNKSEHRGFGFVTFENPADAGKVLAYTHELHSRTTNVNIAKGGTKKLFVGGLARYKTTTERIVHDSLQTFKIWLFPFVLSENTSPSVTSFSLISLFFDKKFLVDFVAIVLWSVLIQCLERKIIYKLCKVCYTGMSSLQKSFQEYSSMWGR